MVLPLLLLGWCSDDPKGGDLVDRNELDERLGDKKLEVVECASSFDSDNWPLLHRCSAPLAIFCGM
jgi:hypothetical protein